MSEKIINFKEASIRAEEREILYYQIKKEMQDLVKIYTKLLNEDCREWLCNGGNFQDFKKKAEILEKSMNAKAQYIKDNFQNEMRIERERFIKKVI